MKVRINPEKASAIVDKIDHFLKNPRPKIGELASVIWSLVFLFLAIPFGKLHYKHLEKVKTKDLAKNRENFNVRMATLDSFSILELNWWKNNIPKAYKQIHSPKVGWRTLNGVFPTGDKRVPDQKNHINHLEIKAIYMATKHYQSVWKGCQHMI